MSTKLSMPKLRFQTRKSIEVNLSYAFFTLFSSKSNHIIYPSRALALISILGIKPQSL